jgi:hypothetical protein
MNLYGWSLSSFTQVLGSKDAAVLDAANADVVESLPNEPGLSRGKAWLRTLIEKGCPLRQEREPPAIPGDGGLLTMQMETEVHAIVVYCIVCAIARDEHLDLAEESSYWAHSSVGALYQELSTCGFSRSPQCGVQYFSWMSKLLHGAPLFGDDFRSDWSFYSVFSNQELAEMIPVFQAAAEFKRTLPADYPAEAKANIRLELSENGKRFIGDLIGWFRRIQQAGQDAFILWW